MSAKKYFASDLPKDFQDCEIISDPLNRLIKISKFEKRIICCPEFQRLRRIKQLGFANFVYPAAEYSRFIHSIGVCHQAKSIVDIINTNIDSEERYQHWRQHGRVDDKPINDGFLITRFERVIISAAGLLHDLPHGPFSHEIEGILTEAGKNLIPDHDKSADNPALFLYLFDKDVSEIAMLLDHFNKVFFEILFHEFKDSAGEPSDDWKKSLKYLYDDGVLTEKGMLNVGVANSPLQIAKNKDNLPVPPEGRFLKLPFLAVAIFEILLFEKQDEWLSPSEYKTVFKKEKADKDWGVTVKTNWTGGAGICWRPIPGWFRAYRKDIIGDTICADLIDYVNRDGYHTGIVSTIDLKFLDRMTIVRAVLPPTGNDGHRSLKPSANTINYEDIPICCEHVVFDIYDNKRGFIRQSVLTEILAYLQARYLLCERVYNHRVVEAARSMLQKAILILGSIETGDGTKNLLAVRDLHPLEKHGPGSPSAPIGDDALLNWVRSLPETKPDIYKDHKSDIDDAIDLATLLQERRVFREAVIFDGLHGFLLPGKLGGPEVSCRALEAAFLTDTKISAELKKCLNGIESDLAASFKDNTEGISEDNKRLKPRIQCLIAVRKWGKRYKPPLVLVIRPLKYPEAKHGSFDVEPLLDCEDPTNIKKQLDALKASYDSLWKVYLFLHPVFHGKLFLDVHIRVNKRLEDFAAEYTGETWKNSIKFEQLLRESLDNVLFLAEPEKAKFENYEVPQAASKLLDGFIDVITLTYPNDVYRLMVVDEKNRFKARIISELQKVKDVESLRIVISTAPGLFKKNITEMKKTENEISLAAREFETHIQGLAIKAISEPLQDEAGRQSKLKL